MYGYHTEIAGLGVDAAEVQAKAAGAPGSRDYAKDLLAQSFEAFKLARRDRPRADNQPFGYSGDAAARSSHDLMNRRTRDLVRNTAQGKRAIAAMANLIVGTGIQTYASPFGPADLFAMNAELESLQDGELGPRLSYALESDTLFEEWANDPEQFDFEGRLSWPDVQRMMIRESANVGSGLLIRCFKKDYKLVPLCYQLIEAEQLDITMDRVGGRVHGDTGEVENKIVGGREFDQDNRCVAYHIFVDHPQEYFGGNMSPLLGAGASIGTSARRERIAAERVIDLTLFQRPSSSGGVTWLDACGQAMWDRDSYMESEMRSAAYDAAFALVAKLKDSEKYDALGFMDENDDLDDRGNRSFKIGHSPLAAVIGTDESLDLVSPTRPNRDAKSFIRLLDGDIAAGLGISMYSLNGDYTATNYTSAKAAKQDEDLNIRPLTNWVASKLVLPVRKQFNAITAASGLFTTISPAEFAKNQRTYQQFDAIGNGRDLIDPKNEGDARTERLRSGMSTFMEEYARVGKHWIRAIMQRVFETRLLAALGVSVDLGGGGGGAVPLTPTDPDKVNASGLPANYR